MATLINGNGNPAVYAGQDADLYAGTIGAATRILNVGSKFAATIEDANTIAIADGVIVTKEGRRIQLDVGSIDEFLIPTGQAGTTRYYIIGYHLYTDGSANQLCETFVQLMNTSTETITENTFRGGFNEVYVSLYRVTQNGLTLNTPAALLSVSETIAQLRDKVNPAMQDILWYGTCATAAATQAKVATTTDRKLTNLTAGQKVAIKMTYNNTHASPTLNVDGKGAKSIKAYGTTAPKVWWKAGDVVTFVYDGTNWLMGVTAGEIEQINSDLTELGWHKVWENPDMSATFNPQTISFASNDFDIFLIQAEVQCMDVIIHNGEGGSAIWGWHSPGTNTLGFLMRPISNISRSGVTFDNAYAASPINGTLTYNNTLAVPKAVYGAHLSEN